MNLLLVARATLFVIKHLELLKIFSPCVDFRYLQSPFLKNPEMKQLASNTSPSKTPEDATKSTGSQENISAIVNSENNSEQQIIRLNNERITIPEILFHPSDIGITQKGIAEAIVECVEECPSEAKHQLLANIVIVGGNACFKNFQDRVYKDVKKNFDENYDVSVLVPPKYVFQNNIHTFFLP